MSRATLTDFAQIWCVDFEFQAPDGDRPDPICLVAYEVRSRRLLRLWKDELGQLQAPPYAIGNQSLFVAYYASAEMGCHLALGWPLPTYVLDLFTEFRVRTNGLRTPLGKGLLGALAYFGLDSMDGIEKADMRELALRGGPWTAEERLALLNYCQSDVLALAKLLPAMAPKLDLPRALLRGRYMRAAAHMEYQGVPINNEALQVLREHWTAIIDRLIARVDTHYGVYEGRTFKFDRFERWLAAHGIAWPRTQSGQLSSRQEIFKDMARAYPALMPLKELRATLAQMRLEELAVGPDGRNRTLLSAFQAKTGRNQPSNTRFIFGPAVWLRGLIQPPPGHGIAYVDWSQQEFGIAAALSGDPAMMAAYRSGDPYLAFAKQAGAVPPEGTKERHSAMRDQFKACALAVQYGMGKVSLAHRIGQTPAEAQVLLNLHHRTYPVFWRWSDRAVDYAMLSGQIHTVFGWMLHIGGPTEAGQATHNHRSLQNYPMQANGAEMLRLACCFAVEQGIHVCAPVHDALLIEASLDELDAVVALTQQVMVEASLVVLNGFPLRSDADVYRFPDHYADKRGAEMWATVRSILEDDLGVPFPVMASDAQPGSEGLTHGGAHT